MKDKIAATLAILTVFCVAFYLYLGDKPIEYNEKFDTSVTGCDNSTEVKGYGHNGYHEKALMYGIRRPQKGFLTIGIPSMKRPANATYIWACLESLLNNTSDQDKKDIVIVIFLSDLSPVFRQSYGKQISDRYPDEIATGLIQIIQAPSSIYPRLTNLKQTSYRHSQGHIKWRSKQNIDYAFMMKYSQNISFLYLQLEDDVTTVPGFMYKIKNYKNKFQEHWTCLEFSVLGFIAKLFHSHDLPRLADLLILFYQEQPNDYTYRRFNNMRGQSRRLILKPTLFQHHGFHSTLNNEIHKQKDKFFKTAT